MAAYARQQVTLPYSTKALVEGLKFALPKAQDGVHPGWSIIANHTGSIVTTSPMIYPTASYNGRRNHELRTREP